MKNKQHKYFTKVPPQDEEMEKSVLSAFIMGSTDTRNNIIKIISAESFYYERNQLIFQCLKEMNDDFTPIDILTLNDKLKSHGVHDEVGGEMYVMEITDYINHQHNAITHAIIVQEKYITREIIGLCVEIETLAYQSSIDLEYLVNTFENKVKALIEKVQESLPNEKKNLVNDVLANIGQIKNDGINKNVYRTGLSMFDNILNIMSGEIIFLAGPPKAAKTKTLIVIMHYLIKRYADELNIKWYCMEDPPDKIIRNRMSIETDIAEEKILGLKGHLTTEEFQSLQESKEVIENSLFLDYKGYPETIDNIYRDYKSFVKEDKMNILIIDNFNMCTDLEYGIKNQTDREIKVSSRIQNLNSHLKHKGYKTCVIVVDHLKKDIELGIEYGFRPSTKDLKGSERKYAILTQLVLANRPGKNRSLVDEERVSSDVEINGKMWKREDLLCGFDSEGLIILERTEARNAKDQGEDVVSRIYAKINTMQFKDLKDL